MSKYLKNKMRKCIKKLLEPMIREVIKDREDEFISTSLRLAHHERDNFRDNTTSFAQ